MILNLNRKVRIRLTDFGRAEFQKQLNELPERYRAMPKEVDGWSEWPLWDVMNTFGKYCYMGSVQLPFATDMELVE